MVYSQIIRFHLVTHVDIHINVEVKGEWYGAAIRLRKSNIGITCIREMNTVTYIILLLLL